MTNTLEGFKLVPLVALERIESKRASLLVPDGYNYTAGKEYGLRIALQIIKAYPDAPTEALREVVEAARRVADAGMKCRTRERGGVGGMTMDASLARMEIVGMPYVPVDDLQVALSRLEAAVGGKGDAT